MNTQLCVTLVKFFLSLQMFTKFLTSVYLFGLGLFERKAILSLKVDLTGGSAQGHAEIMILTPWVSNRITWPAAKPFLPHSFV